MANDLINHAYIKKSYIKAQESLLAGDPINEAGRWQTLTPQVQKLLGSRPFYTLPYAPLYLAAHLHNPKDSTFLSSESHSTELYNLRGLWEAPNLLSARRKLVFKVRVILLGTMPSNLWDLMLV